MLLSMKGFRRSAAAALALMLIAAPGGVGFGLSATLAAAHPAPFDLIFIDADKKNNPRYFEWALKLSRPGTVIIVDNVIRDGQILDPNSKDSDIQGTRALFELLHNEPRVSAIAVPVADSKGYDGFALALVL